MGCSTLADALDLLPVTAAKLEQARQGIIRQGIKLAEGAPLADALQHPTLQALVMDRAQKVKRASLLQRLPHPQAAEVRGAGGPGAAAFLCFPSEAACSIENIDWSTALRQRLHYSRAECAQHELASVSQTCLLTTVQGVVCGQPLDERGFHICTLPIRRRSFEASRPCD